MAKSKPAPLKTKGAAPSCRERMKLRVVAGGLPEFDGVAFGVVETGEATVGVGFGVEGDFDAGGAELSEDGFEIGDAEVDHPLERLRRFGVAEIARVAGKGCERGGAGLLEPRRVVVVGGDGGNAEMGGVPVSERLGIARAEEESADAENFFPGASERKRRHITENTGAPPRPGRDKRRTRKRGPKRRDAEYAEKKRNRKEEERIRPSHNSLRVKRGAEQARPLQLCGNYGLGLAASCFWRSSVQGGTMPFWRA